MERKEKQGYVSDVKKGAKKSKRRSRFFKDSEFTPLNDTIENIFRATKGTIAYPVPERMQVKDAAMKSGKFCQFHDQLGHSTNECRHLRSLVERLAVYTRWYYGQVDHGIDRIFLTSWQHP